MKKQVSDFVKTLGGSSSYSGNLKTMFIYDPGHNDIEKKVVEKFGFGLPFKLAGDTRL